ncbi:hypothetical protein E3E26_00385 [Thermococcus sp. LS1]|uniref:pentapeptide repeat-containing protein n=1 Tax=Thermococcus sp. LS1 TaxID=1638259 RepID=UPI00143B3903|nr:pentapeptide repeat-containing protein [Thermococcus sp. LS1]NJD98265.1 hypothetical protein [Thermococcus sp. LS1]
MCKMAHFGNCDPETADQEYCIFHKPNKSKEEAVEFYRKFLERFKPRVEEIEVDGRKTKRLVFEEPVDAREYVFPKIPDEPIEYKDRNGNKWEQKFSFKYAVFKNTANFNKATFKEDVSFEQVHFEKGVDFIKSNFLGYADFSNAVFHKDTQFAEATFEEIEFFGATFKGRAKFVSCIFKKGADFWFAKFNDAAVFSMSEFKEQAYFHQITFRSKVDFRGCRFEGYTTFSHSQIEDADFKYCRFQDIAEFWNTSFNGNAYFDNSSFEYVVSFEGIDSNPNVRFHKILSFSNCDFRQGIKFIGSLDEEKFQKMFNQKYPQSLQEAARVQRLSYEKEGKRDEADRMFVLERRAYRKVLKNRAKEKYFNAKTPYQKFEAILFLIYAYISTAIETVLADWISLYGTSWGRIILSSFWVITANAILYWTLSHFSYVEVYGIPIGTIYTNGISQGVPGFLNALYYSLVTFTTLGYGDMHPTGWLKALSAIEALTGAVFMALIVAVIARKWMR